jgi:hypothetical protein
MKTRFELNPRLIAWLAIAPMASRPLRSLREQKLDDKRSGDREQDEAQDNPQPCEDEAEDTMGFPAREIRPLPITKEHPMVKANDLSIFHRTGTQ